MWQMLHSAHRMALPVSKTTLSLLVLASASTIRRRRPPNPHQAPRCNRDVQDHSSAGVQPVRPTHPDRHLTLSGRLDIDTRGTLRHSLPHGPVHQRPQCQGPLPAFHGLPDIRVSRRHGWVQPGTELKSVASAFSYQQMLWVLGENIAEAAAVNVFAVIEHAEGGKCISCLVFSLVDSFACDLRSLDLLIHLPRCASITQRIHTPATWNDPSRRYACLCARPPLPLPSRHRTHVATRTHAQPHRCACADHVGALRRVGCRHASGCLLRLYRGRCPLRCAHRVAVLALPRKRSGGERVLPPAGGLGYLAHALQERLVDIQKEHVEWKGWCVLSL